MKSWSHSGFKVWLGENIEPEDDEKRLFISKYLAKCPVSLQRIELLENPSSPTIRYYSSSEHNPQFIDLSPLEFLARLAVHIPKVHERTHRMFGHYSYRTRGVKNREKRFKALIAEDIETLSSLSETKTPSRYWATWIKKVYEVDPIKCRICGGKLKVKSFVLDYRELKAIYKKQTGQHWRAPPKIATVTIQKLK